MHTLQIMINMVALRHTMVIWKSLSYTSVVGEEVQGLVSTNFRLMTETFNF